MTLVRRIFGLHAAEKALDHSGGRVRKAWVDAERRDDRLSRLRQRLVDLGVPVQSCGKRELDRLVQGGGQHQGVLLELAVPDRQGEDDLLAALTELQPPPLLLVLDRVQDPHNLGACLRTADAAGARGVVVPKDQAVGLTATVAKVASGAAETVPIYRVTNLARCLDRLKECGLWIVGAAGEATKTLYEADLTVPLALVLGAEGKGLRRLTQEHCDYLIRIPMLGQVESLNVSVAAGVLLYETVRQRAGTQRATGTV